MPPTAPTAPSLRRAATRRHSASPPNAAWRGRVLKRPCASFSRSTPTYLPVERRRAAKRLSGRQRAIGKRPRRVRHRQRRARAGVADAARGRIGRAPAARDHDVFHPARAALGPYLRPLHGGETGERVDWITWLEPVFADNP